MLHKQQDEYGGYYNELYIKFIDLVVKFRVPSPSRNGRAGGYTSEDEPSIIRRTVALHCLYR